MMETLRNIGFKEAGEWHKGQNRSGIDFSLEKYQNETQILYAFISESTIRYIGKSDNSLQTRMNGYKNASSSQRTNIRVQEQIKRLLKEEIEVKIWAFIDSEGYKHNGVKIRLAAGLEDNLIELIKPEWNFRSNGKTRIKEQIEVSADENVLVETNQLIPIVKSNIKTFKIKTNEAKNGRINFPKKQIDYTLLSEFDSEIRVYLGSDDLFFEARLIDTGGGNARINKALLRDWYDEEHLSEQEYFNLEIIDKTAIKIYK